MICNVTNVFPNNNCINGDLLPTFKFTFNGDFTAGANFIVKDYMTNDTEHNIPERGVNNLGYYNGEEIDIRNWGERVLDQNKEYIWYAKIYEKVDMPNGFYPTGKVATSTTRECPFIDVTVQTYATPNLPQIYIPIETGLTIITPCYVCYGGAYKTVTRYDPTTGLIKLSSKFPSYPAVGTALVISKYKSIDGKDAEGVKMYIETGLNIDANLHNVSNDSDVEIPNSYFKEVSGTTYWGITSYFPKTGVATVLVQTTPAVGTQIQVFTSVVKTPNYYFTTKATPIVTPTMSFENEVIKCSATIGTAGDYPVKYFYWEIYNGDTLVTKSQKIYSGRLEYLFREIEQNVTYTGRITVVTQDDIEVTSGNATCTIAAGTDGINNLKAEFDYTKNAVKLTWTNLVTPTSYMVIRKNGTNVQYIETVQELCTEYYDYSCANGVQYEYIIIPKTTSTVYKQSSVTITPQFKDFSIYFMTEVPYTRPSTSITDVRIYYDYMYGDMQYKVDSVWLLQMDTKIDDIVHNITRNSLHTYAGKPIVTYGNKNYDSFSLSFMLGKMSCPTYSLTGYDQQTFENWKAQISSKRPVLIKDTKGNVWFGAIMSHSFNIDYAVAQYQPYTISCEFSQLRDMKKTRILTD